MSEFTAFVQQCFEVENLSPVLRLYVVVVASLETEMSVDDKVKGVSLIDEIVEDLRDGDVGVCEATEILADLMRQQFGIGITLGIADAWTVEQKAKSRAEILASIAKLQHAAC